MKFEFKNKQELEDLIVKFPCIGIGTQGVVYLDKNSNVVYKIFHSYFEESISEYTKEALLQFSDIKNKTFIWPNEVIVVNNKVVGYTMSYKKANNLNCQNPLTVNLNQFENAITKAQRDIKILTNNDVKIYDIMYNILYANANFYIIDTIEYVKGKSNYKENMKGFNFELKQFLVNGYFEHFIKDSRLLSNLYKDLDADILVFLKEFRKQLSDYLDMDKTIYKLEDAKKLIRKNTNIFYLRNIR